VRNSARSATDGKTHIVLNTERRTGAHPSKRWPMTLLSLLETFQVAVNYPGGAPIKRQYGPWARCSSKRLRMVAAPSRLLNATASTNAGLGPSPNEFAEKSDMDGKTCQLSSTSSELSSSTTRKTRHAIYEVLLSCWATQEYDRHPDKIPTASCPAIATATARLRQRAPRLDPHHLDRDELRCTRRDVMCWPLDPHNGGR